MNPQEREEKRKAPFYIVTSQYYLTSWDMSCLKSAIYCIISYSQLNTTSIGESIRLSLGQKPLWNYDLSILIQGVTAKIAHLYLSRFQIKYVLFDLKHRCRVFTEMYHRVNKSCLKNDHRIKLS